MIPTLSQVVHEIENSDLSAKQYFYSNFPKLNPDLYIRIDTPKLAYYSRFEISQDEWCYNIQTLCQKDWSKYLIYVIYEIWFQMFSIIISLYDEKKASELIDNAIFILESLTKFKNITASRSLYTKLIRACGRSTLSSKVQDIWKSIL